VPTWWPDLALRYEAPQPPRRLRAGALIGAYLGLQLAGYAVKGSPTAAHYDRRFDLADKLWGGAWSLDGNSLRTNMVAHPVMGAAMYQMARGARLSAWESLLWSAAGSAAWEVVEYHEQGSLNDLLVTPVGGAALGEPLFQLGAHLDRLPRTTGREVLSWLVSPWKKLGDLVDGARPARGEPDGRLEVTAFGEVAQARGGGSSRPQAATGLAWRLVRIPDRGAPGRGGGAFRSGEVTGLALSAGASAGALEDVRLESWALLAGGYARDLDAVGRGADLLLGAGLALDLRRHAWVEAGPADTLGLVHAPRLHLEARWLGDGPSLTAGLDAALALGGVRSFALDRFPGAVPPEALPTVQRGYQYHLASGPALRAALTLRAGPASLSAALRADWLRAVLRPDPLPGAAPDARLDDRWLEGALRAAWRLPGGLSLGAGAEWRERWSRAGATTILAAERRLALTVGWEVGG